MTPSTRPVHYALSPLFLAAAAAAALPGVAAAQAPRPLSPPEEAAAIRQSVAPLHNLHVRTRVQTQTYGAAGPLADLFGRTALDDFAWASDGRLYRVVREWEKAPPAGASGAWRENRGAFDGTTLRLHFVTCEAGKPPKTVNADIQQGGKTARLNQANVYNEAIGCVFHAPAELDVWRLHARFLPAEQVNALRTERPLAVPAALETKPYRVAGEEAVGDVPCVVYEWPGVDKIWLAPGLGHAVVKRELTYATTGKPMVRFVNGRFEKALGGLWLPRHVVRELFGGPIDGAAEGKVLVRNDVTCTHVYANTVPDGQFAYDFPAGVTVVDFTRMKDRDGKHRGVSYTVGATPESTEKSLNMALEQHKQLQRGSRYSGVIIWTGVGVVGLAGGFAAVRRFRRAGESA
jgi:hypothetical protein